PYVMDLQAGRSIVQQLLNQGLDVYLIDWGVPRASDHSLQLSDYIRVRLHHVVNYLTQLTGSPQVNLMGYCMGGTLAAIYASLYPDRVRSLILLATPIDFSGDESLLHLWTRKEVFDVDGLIDVYGNCPGAFLQACFQLTQPVQNFVQKYLGFWERNGDTAFLENFFTVERWANDSIPVAGETFRDFIKHFYQENRLAEGRLELRGTRVDLQSVACPLLIVTADRDHLVCPSSSLAIRDLIRSRIVDSMRITAGHLGLAISTQAHQELWPQATAWIVTHSSARF
ncbi:MAG: alpha/beta fold hydrolase, partial [Planctomycetales bacterium]|nr:alpha/beta fold hydrolase [Planctomycetales bacterium]